MPQPKKGEKKKDYLMRAIPFMIHEEGLKPKHAMGKAYGMWENHEKMMKSGGKKTK